MASIKGKKSIILRSGFLVCVALLLVSLPIFSACVPEEVAPPEEEVITIGHFTDMSGPYSSICVGMTHGFMDYIKYRNEQGGINGIPIKLLWVDDRSDAAVVLSTYRRFKEQGIIAFHTNTSVEAVPLITFTKADRIPGCGASTSEAVFTPPGWYYCLHLYVPQAFIVSLKWWEENEWPKRGLDRPPRLAFMSWDSPMGRGGTEPAIRWVKEHGYEVVSELWVSPMAMDFTTEWTVMKEKEPDVMLTFTTGAVPGMIIRDCERLAMPEDLAIIGSEASILIKSCVAMGGEGYRRVITVNPSALLTEENLPGVKLCHDASMKYRGHKAETTEYLLVFEHAWILCEAIKKAMDQVGYENLTGAAVKEYGFDAIDGDIDTGSISPAAYMSFCDFPGDRFIHEAYRVCRWDFDKETPVAISDWLPAPPFTEFK